MKKALLTAIALTFAATTAQAEAPKLGVPPATKKTCPASHPVKGNIVSRGKRKGEKIYHTKESRYYTRTHPERCFKDAAEAKKAGFRAPKR